MYERFGTYVRTYTIKTWKNIHIEIAFLRNCEIPVNAKKEQSGKNF